MHCTRGWPFQALAMLCDGNNRARPPSATAGYVASGVGALLEKRMRKCKRYRWGAFGSGSVIADGVDPKPNDVRKWQGHCRCCRVKLGAYNNCADAVAAAYRNMCRNQEMLLSGIAPMTTR